MISKHPPALRLERTVRDLFGHLASGASDLRPWFDHGRWGVKHPLTIAAPSVSATPAPYEFLPAEGPGLHQVAVGPVHAGIIEPGHFRFTANGETVVRLEERFGYVHKGIEGLMGGADVKRGAQLAGRASVRWEALAAMPLCLLHQGMQYRRILDQQFAARGQSVGPRAIADNYVTMYALVRSGAFVSVVPDAYAGLIAGLDWCETAEIVPSAERRRLGLVVVNRDPLGAMARAGLTVAQRFDADRMIKDFYQTSKISI